MEENKVSTPVELNDEELKAVAGGFFNNSLTNIANNAHGGNATGGNASGTNSVASASGGSVSFG